MKTKEEIKLTLDKIARLRFDTEHARPDDGNEFRAYRMGLDDGYNEAASHLSERVKELDELISENLAGKTNIECPHCNGDVQVYNDDVHLVMCSKNEEIDKLQARIKELEKYNDQLICAAHDSELKFKELESQQQPLLQWLKDERNILQNTGSLMWHKPEDQRKTLEVAEHLDTAIKYIESFPSPPNQNVKE